MTTADLTGVRFGRLVCREMVKADRRRVWWSAVCDCGTERVVVAHHLRAGRTKSCGCLRREASREKATTHGEGSRNPSREYRAWCGLIGRTTNPSHKRWAYYGGRGIAVCDRWRDYRAFLADMGRAPAGTTLDRIDNDGDYGPGNCRWATAAQQMSNRRGCYTIPLGDDLVSAAEFARQKGVSYGALVAHLRQGRSADEALSRMRR